MNTIIKLENLSIGYDGRVVLKEVNAVFEGPGVYLVVGPNGSGKTTLLRAILGLIKPIKGSIRVRSSRGSYGIIEYLPQSFTIPYFPITVLEFLWSHYASIKSRLPKVIISKRFVADASRVMGRLGLSSDTLSMNLNRLSAGQLRRVLLARSLITDPDVLLLDEPFAALDAEATKAVARIIDEESRRRLIVVTSHTVLVPVKRVKGIVLLSNSTSKYVGSRVQAELLPLNALQLKQVAAKAN